MGTDLNAGAENPRNAEPDAAIAAQALFHHGIARRGVTNHRRIALEPAQAARQSEARTHGALRRNGAVRIAARGAPSVEETSVFSRVVQIGGVSLDEVRSE